MKTNPLISVLIPSYNHGGYIADTIQSVLGQSEGNFELLVVDDGSDDQSFDVIKNFARQDKRMVVWKQPNKGLIYTLNMLLERSQGTFIAQIDSDDCYTSDRFSWGIKDLQKHPDAVATFTAHQCMDATGRATTGPVLIEQQELLGAALMRYMAVCNCVCACTGFMRRSAIEAAGGFAKPYSLVHDWDRWLRLSLVGLLHWRPDVGAHYRKHAANQSLQRETSVSQQIAIGQAMSLKTIQHYNLNMSARSRYHSRMASLMLSKRDTAHALEHLVAKSRLEPFYEHESIWMLQCLTLLGHTSSALKYAALLEQSRTRLQPHSRNQLDEVHRALANHS